MKAVILAAGRGSRMKPLTDNKPKPLLVIRGKSFLERTIDALLESGEITEFIIIIGTFGDQIVSFVKDCYPDLIVNFVEQQELSGTGSALMLTESFFSNRERFVVCYADEYFTGEDVLNCLKYDYSWLSLIVPLPERSAEPTVDKNGKIISIIEKPENPKTNRVLGGLMVVNSDIFEYSVELHPTKKEYYLSEMVGKFLIVNDVYIVHAVYNFSFSTAVEVEQFNKMNQ